jgi:hypothetical protein
LQRLKQVLGNDSAFAAQLSELLGFDAATQVLDLFLMQQHLSDPAGTFLFTSSHNHKIEQTIKRWQYVQSLPDAAYINFTQVTALISNKLQQA